MSLTVRDLSVTIGQRTILSDISFSAEPGAITAIVGPNGSGKSTLLKAICGEVPYQGQISLNGQSTASLKPWQLAAMRAVLPQASSLAFPFTVREVVQIGLQAGVAQGERATVAKALAKFGLSGFEDRFYQELSGGEQQRVQMARVLAQVWQPKLEGQTRWLFLDEPVSSLDIAHQLEVIGVAREYAQGGGGVIAVMHDLNLTAMCAESVAVMAEGRVLHQGSPKDTFTDAILSQAYACQVRVNTPPSADAVFFLPHAVEALTPQTTQATA